MQYLIRSSFEAAVARTTPKMFSLKQIMVLAMLTKRNDMEPFRLFRVFISLENYATSFIVVLVLKCAHLF